MIVTWIAIQSQPLPWVEEKTNVAFVACGENAGEISLVRAQNAKSDPSVNRFLDSLEQALAAMKQERPNIAWLKKAIPDGGTSIRFSAPSRSQGVSYESQISQLASQLLPSH